jgi:hypothetical protein
MAKKKPDFKVPLPFNPEKGEDQESKDKSVAVKLTTTLEGAGPPNPTTEYFQIFNQGTTEQYFKWISSLHNMMAYHSFRENSIVDLKTMKGADRDLWLAQCNADSPVVVDQTVSEAAKEALFTASVNLLSIRVLKEDFFGSYQKRHPLQYLFIGKVGVRTFCERLDILSNYITLFPPHENVRFAVLTPLECQAILHDALPPRYIRKMKETNQQLLKMSFDTLRSFALNIQEAANNPGVSSDNDDNDEKPSSNGNSNKKAKSDPIPKKSGGGNNNSNNIQKSILDGSPYPVCYLCGIQGHTVP